MHVSMRAGHVYGHVYAHAYRHAYRHACRTCDWACAQTAVWHKEHRAKVMCGGTGDSTHGHSKVIGLVLDGAELRPVRT